jgi:hypothetical protein
VALAPPWARLAGRPVGGALQPARSEVACPPSAPPVPAMLRELAVPAAAVPRRAPIAPEAIARPESVAAARLLPAPCRERRERPRRADRNGCKGLDRSSAWLNMTSKAPLEQCLELFNSLHWLRDCSACVRKCGAPIESRRAKVHAKGVGSDDFFGSESRVAQMKRKSERYIPYSNWTDSRLIKLHKS